MFDMKACGSRIKALREAQEGLTQERLAELLNTSDSHIRKIENGQRTASIDIYIEIAQYFHVSLDYLLLGKEYPAAEIKADIEDAVSILRKITSRI